LILGKMTFYFTYTPKIHLLIRLLARNTSNGYLIEEGSKTSYVERSSKLGKRFGRLKTSLGFGHEHVFHSLRRTFISQLETNCVDERIAADIVGHVIGTMTYGVYGSGTPIEQRFSVVNDIRYKKLEHLIRAKNSLSNN
jgi:integrase